LEEAELIARAQQGDKEAYIELIQIHQQTVEKFAFQCGVHSNDLADVSQEVCVKLYRFLHQFKQDRFTTWLYKILHVIIIVRNRESWQKRTSLMRKGKPFSSLLKTMFYYLKKINSYTMLFKP